MINKDITIKCKKGKGRYMKCYHIECECGWTCEAPRKKLLDLKARLHLKYCPFKIDLRKIELEKSDKIVHK